MTPVAASATMPLVPGGRLRVLDHFTSPAGLDLRTFLARNRVLFEWIDIDADPLARFLLGAAAAPDGEIEARLAGVRLPVLLLADGRRLEAPSRLEVARAVGLPTRPTQPEYDLAIVGAGPAGLTAAVYAASEGLRTVVMEREAPGGQAGASARIENYPGFPDGISGLELTQRTYEQARRFDAEFVLVNEVTAADPSARAPFRLSLLDGTEMRSRAVLLATGVEYRFLDLPGVAELTGRGICYGSRVSEACLYRGSELFVIGSGNSAAQAAVYFARRCAAGEPARPRRLAGPQHVAVPDPTARGGSQPCGAVPHGAGGGRGNRSARGAGLAQPQHGHRDAGTRRRPGDPDRAEAVYRLGGRPSGARRAGFPAHWPRPASRTETSARTLSARCATGGIRCNQQQPVATGAPALVAGDERTRCIRRGRRASRHPQAHCVSGR